MFLLRMSNTFCSLSSRFASKHKCNEAQLVGWLALQVEDDGNNPVGSIPGVQPVTNAAVMGLNNNQIDALETAFNKPAGHFGGLGATLPARRSAVHAFYTKVVY
jgi:hypothetical protein